MFEAHIVNAGHQKRRVELDISDQGSSGRYHCPGYMKREAMTTPGWYNADGDPPGTQRYWDGELWVGEAVQTPPNAPAGAPMAPPGSSGLVGPDGRRVVLGTPGARMGGRIIDGIIMLVIAVGLTAGGILGRSEDLVIDSGDSGFEFSYNQTLDSPLSYLIWGLLGWAWAFGWTHLKGGTPGKLILGMRVVDAATHASPVGAQQALLRTGTHGLAIIGILSTDIGDLSSLVAVFIGLASLIMLFNDDQHRTVMDRVAKTLVLK